MRLYQKGNRNNSSMVMSAETPIGLIHHQPPPSRLRSSAHPPVRQQHLPLETRPPAADSRPTNAISVASTVPSGHTSPEGTHATDPINIPSDLTTSSGSSDEEIRDEQRQDEAIQDEGEEDKETQEGETPDEERKNGESFLDYVRRKISSAGTTGTNLQEPIIGDGDDSFHNGDDFVPLDV